MKLDRPLHHGDRRRREGNEVTSSGERVRADVEEAAFVPSAGHESACSATGSECFRNGALEAGAAKNFGSRCAKRHRKSEKFLDVTCDRFNPKRVVEDERRADDVGEGGKSAT
jgi:hypothetical protein